MKVIDLSHTIKENMPLYPGTPGPKFTEVGNYDRDGFREILLQFCSHTGTHMDSPAHIIKGGRTLDQFPIEQFIGKALVIDCRNIKENGRISMKYLLKYGKKLEQADFLLFNLGRDVFWGKPEYFEPYPCVDDEVLNFIISRSYKGIGFDVIGLDPVDDVELKRHKKLFENAQMINIENLKNLDLCGEGLFDFSCFPLKIENSDGCPIRAVAWFE